MTTVVAVTDLAAAAFGRALEPVRDLLGEHDRNLLVRADDGALLVLKVAGPTRSRAALERENRFLRHLSAHLTGVAVPEPVSDLVDMEVEGTLRCARLLRYLPGRVLADLPPSPRLLHAVGETAAEVSLALRSAAEPDDGIGHEWDLRRGEDVVAGLLADLTDTATRDVVAAALAGSTGLSTQLSHLPQQWVHHDLNDHNLLVDADGDALPSVTGVLDVADVLHTARMVEVVVAVAYGMLRSPRPLRAATTVLHGFTSRVPLTETEVDLIFPLAALRLATNAAMWSSRSAAGHNLDYARRRSQHTLAALKALLDVPPALAVAALRQAAGLDANAPAASVAVALAAAQPVPLVDLPVTAVDLSPDAVVDGAQTPAPGSASRHGAPRTERASLRRDLLDEPAVVALGVDVFCPVGTLVCAPLAGVVVSVGGRWVCVRHDGLAGALTYYSAVIPAVDVGHPVRPGDTLGAVDQPAAGDEAAAVRTAHLRLQVAVTALGDAGPPPAFVPVAERNAWLALCPDPTPLLGRPAEPPPHARAAQMVQRRSEVVGRSQRSYFLRPPLMVQARDVWFTDEDGHQYLDAVNNVTHIGHGHPHVLEATIRQSRRLNTNSRYLYGELTGYAERLVALLPAPLDVVFFACTGSEANDLALRMARLTTGREDVLVLGGAYHGNTTAVQGISPNRFRGAGGSGPPSTTHELEQPDRYRGRYGYADTDAGARFAADAARVIDDLDAAGTPPSALFAESLMGTAGQVLLPPGYLAALFARVRRSGGLCVSDEVQVGIGRLGTSFWGFQDHGVVPDIVTMGKPMGNGYPMSAVVTTREIADAFDNGMRYFNTFAGNPVACAVGSAVLDVVVGEGLQAAAGEVGEQLLAGLWELHNTHPLIGDVRGQGLYAGIELVTDRSTKAPAAAAALAVSERMKDLGVLTYPNGAHDNILKFKPPMTFQRSHADLFVETLDRALAEVAG